MSVADRVAALEAGTDLYDLPGAETSTYPFLVTADGNEGEGNLPLTTLIEHAESLITALAAGDGIKLGLPEIDIRTRGFRPTDLVTIAGFSHQGKTQVALNLILNNPDRRILMVTLDDPPEMILCKLVAMQTGWPAEEIEEAVKQGDHEALSVVRRCASEVFENLILHDQRVSVEQLDHLTQAAHATWGAGPELVIIDYLDLLRGVSADDEYSSTKKKADALKGWASHQAFPTVVLHQATRTGGSPGRPISITSMAFSGEQQSTIIIGVRRKKDDQNLDAAERKIHDEQNTVTLHIVKNKRPGGRLTPWYGVDYQMDADTGRVGAWRRPRPQHSEGYSGGN